MTVVGSMASLVGGKPKPRFIPEFVVWPGAAHRVQGNELVVPVVENAPTDTRPVVAGRAVEATVTPQKPGAGSSTPASKQVAGELDTIGGGECLAGIGRTQGPEHNGYRQQTFRVNSIHLCV